MKGGRVGGVLMRAGGAFVFGLALVLAAPSAWLRLISPLVAVATDGLCPQMDTVSVDVEGSEVHAEGRLHLDLTLSDGAPLPDMRAWWKKSAWKTQGVLVVALAIWACPAVGWRRRWVVFPAMLAAAAAVSAYDLGIEIQEVILRDLVPRLLQDHSLAQSAANQAALDQLESWHQGILWVRRIQEGGGRMFLAVLAGCIGYGLPLRGRVWGK